MVCKKCGTAVLDDGATYCSACGSRLDGKKACVSCGKLNDVDFTYCVYCGGRMDGKTVCSACGTAYNGQFCPACGKSEDKQPQGVAMQTRIKKEEESVCGQGKVCKIFDIVSGGLLMAGVLFALIFVFLISLTAEISPSSLAGTVGVSENISIFDYFGKYYKELGELDSDTWFGKLLYNNELTFGLIGTGIVAVTLPLVVAFASVATVVYVRNLMGLTKRKADKWAIVTVLSFLAGVIAFFGLHKVSMEYIFELKIVATPVTNWGIVLSAIALIGGVACKIVAGGKENLRAKKIVGLSLSLGSIVFCCLLFSSIGNYATALNIRSDAQVIDLKLGTMVSSSAIIALFETVMASLGAQEYQTFTANLEVFTILNTVIQILLLLLMVAIVESTHKNFKNFFEKKQGSTLGVAIIATVLGLVCLILHIVANGCLMTMFDTLAETEEIKIITGFASPICLFVFSILNLAVACVHSVLNSKWKKLEQAE